MSSDPESSLEAGLTALKQGDYQSAIPILEVIAANATNSACLQAQVGLVVAYGRSGNLPSSIALCQTLTQSNNPQVKEWADRTLAQLTIYNKNDKESNVNTGFVPFESSAPPPPVTSVEKRGNGGAEVSSADTSPTPDGNTVVPVNREKAKPLTIHWRQAGRAKAWQPLQKPNLIPLRLLFVGTFVALFWTLRELVCWTMALINDVLVKLPYWSPFQFLYSDPTQLLLLLLLFLTGVSPWLLDWLLTEFYRQRSLDKEVLNQSSKEAVRVLHRYCQQQSWQFPKLRILPLKAPIALTYGNLPRTARIVVSQGLLDQLADDEIATIYATQLGHIAHWDFAVISVVLLVTIPVYQLYRQFSQWGDRTTQRIWQSVVGVMASLVYGVWCLLTGTALLNSRLRLYSCDRLAAEITGNPNGLIRALLKIAIGIAGDIEKQEHTPWQLESLNLLMLVGYKQSLCLGSIAPNISFDSFLMWDYLNPYREWFAINNSHALMGDRIGRLCEIARHWRLQTELNIETQQPLKVRRQSFFLQIAPFLGIPLGAAFGCLIWLIWQTAFALKLLNLKWIYEDWSFITGCLFIGFSIGILIRINSFFPNIKANSLQTDDRLPNLLTNPAFLPIDSNGVRLVGKLLGRRGTSNWLGQDLILHTSIALVKLHHISWLGQQVNPQDLIGRQVIVTGWLRRGATPWIDIQTLQTQTGKTINSPHPIWSTVLAVAAEAWGAYILLRG